MSVNTEIVASKDSPLPVKLVFDTWTPRAHFIVVQKQAKPDATEGELNASYELIGNFLSENSELNPDAILSFHRGAWGQLNTKEWHAHLCVPKAPYLKLAKLKIKKENIPNNAQWIDGVKDVEKGMDLWYARETKKYERYKNDCIAKKQTCLNENGILAEFHSNQSQFELVWMSIQPRIGIVVKSGMQATLMQLYQYMKEIYNYLESQLRNYGNNMKYFGCHFCLHVCASNNSNVVRRQGHIFAEDGKSIINHDLIGYIQLDETVYSQSLPRKFREKWFDAFENAVHFVDT